MAPSVRCAPGGLPGGCGLGSALLCSAPVIRRLSSPAENRTEAQRPREPSPPREGRGTSATELRAPRWTPLPLGTRGSASTFPAAPRILLLLAARDGKRQPRTREEQPAHDDATSDTSHRQLPLALSAAALSQLASARIHSRSLLPVPERLQATQQAASDGKNHDDRGARRVAVARCEAVRGHDFALSARATEGHEGGSCPSQLHAPAEAMLSRRDAPDSWNCLDAPLSHMCADRIVSFALE
jgi:hypothetical protein